MFILDHNGREPLYKQLYWQIRSDVLSGKMSAHSRLPSVRDLAVELSTSRNTVDGAYQELLAEGYIYSKERSGYFVSALDQHAAPLSLDKEPLRSSALKPAPVFAYDFHPARLDPAGFPVAQWRTCFLECLRENSHEYSRYGEFQGDWGLRSNIQQYLERARGVICDPDQIVICAGLQHGLDLVAHLLKENQSTVAVEGSRVSSATCRLSQQRVQPYSAGRRGGRDRPGSPQSQRQ